MTPDKDQNINLLPADLQRKREVIKKAIASQGVEYTASPAEKPPRSPWFARFRRPKADSAASAQPFSTKLPPKIIKPAEAKPAAVPSVPKPELKPAPAPSVPAPPPAPTIPKPPVQPIVPPISPPAPSKVEAKQKSAEMFDVNLLSGEYAQAFVPQNQKFVFTTAVTATALVILLSYAGVYLYQVNKESSTRATAQINEELKKTMASYAPLEAEDTALQKKVAGLTGLLANHVSFKSFLERLEAATIPEVTYTMIALSRSGDMSLTALATSYTALARQLAILQKDTPWVQSAIITAASLARDNQAHARGVEFEVSIKIDPAVFKLSEGQ